MRDLIIVTVLALTAAFVADRVWFDGKYFGTVSHELGWNFSSVQRK